MNRRLVLALGLGLAAACGGASELPIEPPEPAYRIVFEPPFQSEVVVMLGTTGQVEAKVVDRHGVRVIPDDGPTFRSTNPAVLTVDATGHFTAVGTARAAIIAEARVGSDVVLGGIGFVVACTAELRVSFSPVATTLDVGERFVPTLSVTTCGGQVPVNEPATWSAADPTVLAVDAATGETVALKSGTSEVRAMMNHGVIGVIPVTVR